MLSVWVFIYHLLDFMRFKDYKIIIWWHPYNTHTHSWIHYWFHRAFEYLWYDVDWVDNHKDNLPSITQKTIFITEHQVDSQLLENMSPNWIVFDHNYWELGQGIHIDSSWKYTWLWKVIPFGVETFAYPNNPYVTPEIYRWYLSIPRILWATDRLPHEIKFMPYHYSMNKEILFIGSYWTNNMIELEKARIWSYINKKIFVQKWKHILWRGRPFVPEEDIALLSQQALLAPSIQGWFQCNNGYIPCRLLKNISYSVLGISNNLYVANLFSEDEVIVDRDIFSLLDKAQKVVKDKKVDDYTRKALEKVKNEHTYINRIEQLFSYL